MQKLVYTLFIVIFLVDILVREELIPRAMIGSPEILSMTISAIVVLLTVKQKGLWVSPLYLIIFAFFGLHVVFGIIVNEVQSTAVFNGLRYYFMYVPLFFLPAAYAFSDIEIKNQLRLLFGLALLQLPISINQRFFKGKGIEQFEASGALSGDIVRGTFNSGGHQTVFITCVITCLLAFYLKKRIKKPFFLVAALLLFLPATINETKSSMFLLPAALLVPVLISSDWKEKFKNILVVSVAAAVLLALFVAAYDKLYTEGTGHDNVYEKLDYFGGDSNILSYLAPSTTMGSDRVGKIDKLIIPIIELSDNPVKLAFGVGMGNTLPSMFGSKLAGAYTEQIKELRGGLLPNLLWEFGLLGTLLVIAVCFLVLRDAWYLKKSNDLLGAVALGWIGVIALIAIASSYRDFISANIFGYLLMYFSGYIAAAAVRARAQESGRFFASSPTEEGRGDVSA